jgi:hypothetical protein
MKHIQPFKLFEAKLTSPDETADMIYREKTHTMQNIKPIESFLQESETINEMKSPFYDSVDAIKAILSSQVVASKMKMKPVSIITNSIGGAVIPSQSKVITYNVSNTATLGSQPIIITVKLERVIAAGDKYGDNATYKVVSVQPVPTR